MDVDSRGCRSACQARTVERIPFVTGARSRCCPIHFADGGLSTLPEVLDTKLHRYGEMVAQWHIRGIAAHICHAVDAVREWCESAAVGGIDEENLVEHLALSHPASATFIVRDDAFHHPGKLTIALQFYPGFGDLSLAGSLDEIDEMAFHAVATVETVYIAMNNGVFWLVGA